jgi:hypothetical protein
MAAEQLRANIETDLKFFRRNKILLGATLLYLAFTALMLIPSIIFGSLSKHFDILKTLHDSLGNTVTVFTALMGLLYMASHFRSRNVKMVLTKPCTPETWLASLIIAAAAVSLVLNLVAAAISGVLFAVWGIPFQGGLIFVTLDNYLSGLVIFAFVVFLATSMPPVLAVIVAIIASESTIYWLRTIVAAGIDANVGGLNTLDKLLYGIYMILPSYSLFHHQSETVFETWRVAPRDWLPLLYAAVYTVATMTLFYLLTLVVLRRKSLG